MGYQVALAPSARRDLREIVRYISQDSPQRARTFGDFLVAQAKRLADFPHMGRIVPELDDQRIRELIVRSYRVIYAIDGSAKRVDILRFWHGARGTPDLERL